MHSGQVKFEFKDPILVGLYKLLQYTQKIIDCRYATMEDGTLPLRV